MLIKLFLLINKLFPKKSHPFNESINWTLDLNYTDFEYKHTPNLLKMYSDFIDLDDLKNKKILDIWCWWWWKSIFIAKKYNSNIIWIDTSNEFLNQANKKLKELNLTDKISFFYKNALNTGFKENIFDIIILSDVLEHIQNTEKLLIECNRLLKKWWYILFDFASYYHYFWHHIWDSIRIPWLHLITTESFRIKLYEKSIKNLIDRDKRISLRIGLNNKNKRSFTYLNKITRKDFEKIIQKLDFMWIFKQKYIKYFYLKKMNFFAKIPFLKEIMIKHIVWILKK